MESYLTNQQFMNFIKKTIYAIVAIAATLTSCSQDDTLMYNNITMGNMTNGTFISDQGNIFNVVEKNCYGNLEEMNRAIVLCDVLNKVEGTENQYDIRLNDVASVLTKAPINRKDADSNDETLVQDPISIENMWISGGYINMYLVFEVKSLANTKKHLVNLVLDEKESSEGKYVFVLRHNSYGESLKYDATNLRLGDSYVSFPITDIIKEDSADITIKWEWYKIAGDGLSSEVQDNCFNLSYTKGGFEHVPHALTVQNRRQTQLN